MKEAEKMKTLNLKKKTVTEEEREK